MVNDEDAVAATLSSAAVLQRGTVHPTLDSLGPDIVLKDWLPEIEWVPYSDAELHCAVYLRHWLGADAFRLLPHDFLVAFIRGHAYRRGWRDVALVYLELSLAYRHAHGVDMILGGEGVSGFASFVGGSDALEEFDSAMPSGIIGHDAEGHVVVLDQPFASSSARLMKIVDDDGFMRHMIARREAGRAALAAESARRGKRLYKCISVIDFHGLGWSHLTDTKFHSRMKRFFDFFSDQYPETQDVMILINAPRLFAAFWSVAKRFLHPMVVAKVSVAGSDYRPAFEERGIILQEGATAEPPPPGSTSEHETTTTTTSGLPPRLRAPPRWIELLAALKAEHSDELLTRNYLPAEDARALERVGLL